MKTSTSFCLFGFFIADCDLTKFGKLLPPERSDETYYWYDVTEMYLNDLLKSDIKNKNVKFQLEFVLAEDGVYIGADPCTCPDSMSMGTFKKNTQFRLNKIFKDLLSANERECGFMIDTVEN